MTPEEYMALFEKHKISPGAGTSFASSAKTGKCAASPVGILLVERYGNSNDPRTVGLKDGEYQSPEVQAARALGTSVQFMYGLSDGWESYLLEISEPDLDYTEDYKLGWWEGRAAAEFCKPQPYVQVIGIED